MTDLGASAGVADSEGAGRSKKSLPAQEKFCVLVAGGMTLLDAYHNAYPKTQKWKNPNAAKGKGSVLASQPHIAARIAELRAGAVKQMEFTVVSHLRELDRLKNLALQDENYTAAIRAEELRGKVAGFYVEKRENGKPGDFADDQEALKRRIQERQVKLGLLPENVTPIRKDVA